MPDRYDVQIKSGAARELKSLPRDVAELIARVLLSLEENPVLGGASSSPEATPTVSVLATTASSTRSSTSPLLSSSSASPTVATPTADPARSFQGSPRQPSDQPRQIRPFRRVRAAVRQIDHGPHQAALPQ